MVVMMNARDCWWSVEELVLWRSEDGGWLVAVGGLWLISEKSKRYDFIHYLITVTVATKHSIFADMPPEF
jgi:hypothetical protein